MIDILIKIVPIILTFLIGYLLKKFKIFSADDGGKLLKLGFYVASPALTFMSVFSLKFSISLLMFPLLCLLMVVLVYFVSSIVVNKFALPKSTRGVFLIATMIMNTAFTLPFLLASYGQAGIARLAMFDFANGLLTYSFIYSIAVKHGRRVADTGFIIKKILISPPIWALVVGILVNLFKLTPPVYVSTLLTNLSGLASPLVLLALGLYFTPKVINLRLTSGALVIRFAIGTVLAFVLTGFLGMRGIDREIGIILASAPLGFNTLTFSSMENLDTKYAASLISAGIIVGMVFIPSLLYSFKFLGL